MSSTDAHQGFGEEQKAAMSPGAERRSGRWQAVDGTSRERLRELRAKLDHALSKYYFGKYKEADETLSEVMPSLEEMRTSPPMTEGFEESPPSLLYAAACALQGQIHDRGRDDRDQEPFDRVQEAFSRAVTVFDKISKAGELPAQYYAEYGVALRMVGERQQDAHKYLERAISLGFSTPETHRHLGLILKDKGDYNEAIDEFQKALKLAPDDPLIHKALDETWKARGLLGQLGENNSSV